jgi:hypothetical protein
MRRKPSRLILRGLGQTIRISKWIGRQDSSVAEYAICRKLARLLDFKICHIAREDNIEAHTLAAAARSL